VGSRKARRRSSPASPELHAALHVSGLQALGVAVVCAKVALVPLVFDPSLDRPFVVSKALLSHGLTYVLVGVMVGVLIRSGRSAFVWSWLHLPVLAFLLISCAATLFAADPFLALYGTHERMLGLGSIVDVVVLYLAVISFVRRPRDAIAMGISALGAAGLVLGYEVVQMLRLDPFSWSIDSVGRPFSSLGEATALAQYLTVLALGTVSVGLLFDRLRLPLRLTLLMFSGLLLVGAAATGTRSALLGLTSGSAVLVLLVLVVHPSRRARVLALAGAVGAAAIFALLLVFSPLGERLATTIDPPGVDEANDELLAQLGSSGAARVALYQIGIEMVSERPLLGFGPDNFLTGVPRHRPEQAPEYVRQSLPTSAHSWVVQVATSSGLIGLVSFVSIALVAFAMALRSAFRPIAIAGVAMIAAFLGTGLTSVNESSTEWLFWAAVGVVAAATAPAATPEAEVRRDAKRRLIEGAAQFRRWAPRLVLVAAAAAALSGLTAVDASRAARASQLSRLNGEVPQATDLALRSVRSDPGRAEYWHTLGLAYVASARWRDALTAFGHASKLLPYDVRYIGDLARVYMLLAQEGDVAAGASALEAAERAVRVDANNPRAHHTRAIVMQVLGNLPEALRSAERALFLDPESRNGSLYVTATQVMVASGRAPDAIRISREGLVLLGRSRNSIPVRIELARALVASGQQLEAIAELDLALAIQPNEPTAQRLRAEIQAALRK
jgi:O-antigen ligase/cytochrome c-type biogenesis protein CcmH/NrfG